MNKYTVILEHDYLIVDADYYDVSDHYLDFFVGEQIVCTFCPNYWRGVTILKSSNLIR